MKKLFITMALVITTLSAYAERGGGNGVVFVRTATEEALEPALLDTADQINKGTYPWQKYNDDCDSFARRKVYAVEVGGKRYRSGADGRLTPYWFGTIKYRCR
ncbi:MAG: hypothetical protein KDD34_04385 [Bdellovibrionales bacterium]|nr:hypothetical protein [Bdellovibrionales bacterium]